jgi:uncharacterized protein (TIGR02246 family)
MTKLSFLTLALAASLAGAFVAPAHRTFSPSFVTTSSTCPVAKPSSTTSLNLFGRLFGAKRTIAPPQDISEAQVRALFYVWNDALATGESRIVAKRYSNDPILLPTVSDTPRTDFDSIKDYFDNFLTMKPQGTIIDGKIQIGHNWAEDAGIYVFTMGSTGAKVKARYTFVYVYEDGEWKIAHHHSSTMPEGPKPGPVITEEEVKKLFYKWNDALATLDSTTVANRYAKAAVLLPTVSDVPRTDFASIKNYFDNFLKLKPQGVIVDSYVAIGEGWCKDVGIYHGRGWLQSQGPLQLCLRFGRRRMEDFSPPFFRHA